MGWCAQGLRSATRPAGKRRGEGGGGGGGGAGEGGGDGGAYWAKGVMTGQVRGRAACPLGGAAAYVGGRGGASEAASGAERSAARIWLTRASAAAPTAPARGARRALTPACRRCSKTPPRQQQQQQQRAPPPPRKARWAQARVLRPTRPRHSSPPAKAWPSQAGVTPQRWATSCAYWRSIGKRASGAGSTWRRRSPLAA